MSIDKHIMKTVTQRLSTAVLCIAVFVLAMTAIHYADKASAQRLEISRLSRNLAHASIPFSIDTIRDTVSVVTQTVVEVPRRDLLEALSAERQLVKDLRLRIRQLETLQTTVTTVVDSVRPRFSAADSTFSHADHWASITFSLPDTTFRYAIRDSLVTVVSRNYRHRFLWWRWGTKGYQVRIVNFNPHAHVIYNRYVSAHDK